MERKSLSDILNASQRVALEKTWEQTQAAGDFALLPAGEYVAHVLSGELITGRTNGTPGYRLTFQVAEGEFRGRKLWHDIWLTKPAMPMAKRDLNKLGITSLLQLEKPLPIGIRCKVQVALRRDDNGTSFNRVRHFEVVGIDQPEADPFAPEDDAKDSGDDQTVF